MAQQNTSQARIVDPILTEVARGYANNDMVGQYLFPVVPVPLRAGQIIQFGKEDFKLYNTARGPGQNTKRVQFGYAGDKYALIDHSLEGMVPIEILEEGRNGPGIDHGVIAVTSVQNIMALGLEQERANKARDASKYTPENKATLSGKAQWSDPESEPINQVSDAIDAVRQKIGRRPNTMVIGAGVFKALKVNRQIIERIKYTGRDVPTVELLASLFDVKNLYIGDAIYTEGDAFVDVWGNDAILAYVDITPLPQKGSPSYGYTYQLRGTPFVEPAYYEANEKSWFYPVTDARDPVIAGSDAGFLFQNAVA